MPKFITLPRRRRRRRRNADGSTGPLSPAEAEQRDLAEAQRRSLADTMGGGPTSRRDRSNRSNDDGQTPSREFEARLDDMLREVSLSKRNEISQIQSSSHHQNLTLSPILFMPFPFSFFRNMLT